MFTWSVGYSRIAFSANFSALSKFPESIADCAMFIQRTPSSLFALSPIPPATIMALHEDVDWLFSQPRYAYCCLLRDPTLLRTDCSLFKTATQ